MPVSHKHSLEFLLILPELLSFWCYGFQHFLLGASHHPLPFQHPSTFLSPPLLLLTEVTCRPSPHLGSTEPHSVPVRNNQKTTVTDLPFPLCFFVFLYLSSHLYFLSLSLFLISPFLLVSLSLLICVSLKPRATWNECCAVLCCAVLW